MSSRRRLTAGCWLAGLGLTGTRQYELTMSTRRGRPQAAPDLTELLGHGTRSSSDEVDARLPIRFTDTAVRQACAASEHVLDALVGAMVTRATTLDRTDVPPAGT